MWSKLVPLVAAAAAVLLLCGCSGRSYELVKEPVGGIIVTGEFPPALLVHDPDFEWYRRTYSSYSVDSVRAERIRKEWRNASVIVFLGTWCSDSKREVPRFMKIAATAGVGEKRVTLYGLDRMRRSPKGFEQDYGIRLVPTFIFLRDGKEVGRIVESPKRSLEEDTAEILGGAD